MRLSTAVISRGPTGDTGATGATGETGATGSTGADGANGTRPLKIAHAGYQWQADDVAFFIATGQSNAQGFDLVSDPATHPSPAGPLANVKVVKAQVDPIAFDDYSSTNNQYTETNGSTDAGSLQEFARVWQAEVDGGATIPDLYAISIADGAAGFEKNDGNRQWASDGLDDGGTPFTEFKGLWALYQNAIPLAIAAIRALGKEPVLVAHSWIQGEQDSDGDTSSLAYAANVEALYQMFSSVLGVDQIPLYTAEIVSPGRTYRARINEAFDELRARHPSVVNIKWADFGSYNEDGTSNYGIFQTDNLHYTGTAQAYLAQRIYDRLADREVPYVVPDPDLSGARNAFLRRVPDSIAVVEGGASAAGGGDADIQLDGISRRIRSKGLAASDEGHFLLMKRSFGVGVRSQKPDLEDFGFEMEVGIVKLPQAVNGVLRISGGGTETLPMASDGSESGFILEFACPTTAGQYDVRLGVANDAAGGTMTWTATQTLTYSNASDPYAVISISVSEDGGTITAIYTPKDRQGTVLTFTASGLPDSGDANLVSGGNVQISAHVLAGTSEITCGDFSFIRIA